MLKAKSILDQPHALTNELDSLTTPKIITLPSESTGLWHWIVPPLILVTIASLIVALSPQVAPRISTPISLEITPNRLGTGEGPQEVAKSVTSSSSPKSPKSDDLLVSRAEPQPNSQTGDQVRLDQPWNDSFEAEHPVTEKLADPEVVDPAEANPFNQVDPDLEPGLPVLVVPPQVNPIDLDQAQAEIEEEARRIREERREMAALRNDVQLPIEELQEQADVPILGHGGVEKRRRELLLDIYKILEANRDDLDLAASQIIQLDRRRSIRMSQQTAERVRSFLQPRAFLWLGPKEIRALRRLGAPERLILDNVIRSKMLFLNQRGGPRDRNEAIVLSALELVTTQLDRE